jgi:hypothetical protein
MMALEIITLAAGLFCACAAVLFFAASIWWDHRDKVTWHEVYSERMPWYVKIAERFL